MEKFLHEEPIVPRTNEEKQSVINRLKRIEGQVRGIQRMVEEDRYCVDILVQISAINAALKKVGFSVAERHTKHCVSDAVQTGNGHEAIDELMEVMKQYSKKGRILSMNEAQQQNEVNQQHKQLGVTGMTCAACSNRIEKTLNKMEGVEAQVNVTTERATIDYDSDKTSIEDITNKIENVGYGVLMDKSELDVFGMTCAACSTRIEKVLNKQEGVKSANVNLTTETASVEYNPGITDTKALIDKIKNV